MNHEKGQVIHQSCKFRILLHKCIKVICKISMGIRQHKRGLPVTPDSEYLWKHHQSQACLFEDWGECSSNCIHKWQLLGHYKFFIPVVMFFAVSFQNSVCNSILSVIFPGPYCGIHTEARELHVKFWDQFQAIESMLVWGSMSFVSSSLLSFSTHSLRKHTVPQW